MEKGLGQVPSQVPSQVLHPSFFIGANVRLEIGLVQQLDILTIGIVIIGSHISRYEMHTDRTICEQLRSRVAQRKRAGPITQRSVDRNYALLTFPPLQPFGGEKSVGSSGI